MVSPAIPITIVLIIVKNVTFLYLAEWPMFIHRVRCSAKGSWLNIPIKTHAKHTKVTIQLVDPVASSPLVDSHNSLQWKMAHVQMISDELPVSEKKRVFVFTN